MGDTRDVRAPEAAGGGEGAGSAPQTPGRQTLAGVHQAAEAGVSGGGGPLPFLAQIQKAFGPAHDLSAIRAHVGGAAQDAGKKMGAHAYATRDQIAFATPPDLHTAAHEAAHVIQQRAGVSLGGGVGEVGDTHERNADAIADLVVAGQSAAHLLPRAGAGTSGAAVQMRRVPDAGPILSQPENRSANIAGMRLVIRRALDEMNAAQRTQVQTRADGAQTHAEFLRLPEQQQLTRTADAIRAIDPGFQLGDPHLIDVGPQNAAQRANIDTLANGARAVFTRIAGGGEDASLGEVFGAANVATAKAKYAAASAMMDTLRASNHIVTDRSGYNAEVSLGGLTAAGTQISLEPDAIDHPTEAGNIITMIHESMHAGNPSVTDLGYIDSPAFTNLPEATKLDNAAHFEVVPRRILGVAPTFAGQTFVPAGGSSGGHSAPPLTPVEQAVRDASEDFRSAWTMGLNLHNFWNDIFQNPALWTQDMGGKRRSTSMPYWSKVEKLTVHQKRNIDPTSANPAMVPVSTIDMALSEGFTRKLAAAMFAVPTASADMTHFAQAHASASEIRTMERNPRAYKRFFVRRILQQLGSITGTVDRDEAVVTRLVQLNANFGSLFDTRNPRDFPFSD